MEILRKIKFTVTLIRTSLYFFFFYRGKIYDQTKDETILFFIGSAWAYLAPLEILLYHIYRARGYKVRYLVYDDSIPISENTRSQSFRDILKKVKLNYILGKSVLMSARVKFEVIKYKECDELNLLSLEDLVNYKVEDIPLGQMALDATFPFLQTTEIDESFTPFLRRFLSLAISNYRFFEELIRKGRPDHIFMSHGIYATWGPIQALCKKHGLKYICYDRAKNKDAVNFNKQQIAPDWSIDCAWIEFSKINLSKMQEQWIDDELKKRIMQKHQVFQYNQVPEAGSNTIVKQRLGISKDTKVITFYSNLIWDAANVSRDIVFANFEDCIKQTIEKYAGNDITFILRPHPAEQILGTAETYANKFSRHILKNNLIIAGSDYNSFDILNITDVNIVNTSFVGLEAAVLGQPVILVSDTHYRNKGFTYDPQDVSEYFAQIDELLKRGSNINELGKHLARKYFYVISRLYQIDSRIRYENRTFREYRNSYNFLLADEGLAQITDDLVNNEKTHHLKWQ